MKEEYDLSTMKSRKKTIRKQAKKISNYAPRRRGHILF